MNKIQFHNKNFEVEVRDALQIYDREITQDDALKLYGLECSNFTFDAEDCETLCLFKNLDRLDINLGFENLSFLEKLQNLEVLYIEFYRQKFDCDYLTPLKKLEVLTISGGDVSGFVFHNFEKIAKLPSLKSLGLHEFGSVDLTSLKDMHYLKDFFCGYGNNVHNIEEISNLRNLKSLRLIDLVLPNLNFLRTLPSDMFLELCGIEILEEVNLLELELFEKRDISEIKVNGKMIL